jgi:hypothetical protein
MQRAICDTVLLSWTILGDEERIWTFALKC